VHAPCEDKRDDVKDSFYEELRLVFDQFPTYDMKVFLSDFSVKVGKIFSNLQSGTRVHTKLVMIMELRVVTSATSKNLVVKSTMFHHRSIHKYTWTFPHGQTHNQIDYDWTDRRRHSSILDIRSLRVADCDTDHYLVVANLRERLAVSKRPVNKMDMDRFNLEQLNEGEVKEQHQVTIITDFQLWKT
jgi:hypothetical protein